MHGVSQSAAISASYLNNANKTSHKLMLKAKFIIISNIAVRSVIYCKSVSTSHYKGVYCYVHVVSTVHNKANVCYLFILLLLFLSLLKRIKITTEIL
jgi:hypothetical protein